MLETPLPSQLASKPSRSRQVATRSHSGPPRSTRGRSVVGNTTHPHSSSTAIHISSLSKSPNARPKAMRVAAPSLHPQPTTDSSTRANNQTSGPTLLNGLLPGQTIPIPPGVSQAVETTQLGDRLGQYNRDDDQVRWTRTPSPQEPNSDLALPSGPLLFPSPQNLRDREEEYRSISPEDDGSGSLERLEKKGYKILGDLGKKSKSKRAEIRGYPTTSRMSQSQGSDSVCTSGREESLDIPLGQGQPRVLVSNSTFGGYSSSLVDSSNSILLLQRTREPVSSTPSPKKKQRVSKRGMALPSGSSWGSYVNRPTPLTPPANQEALRKDPSHFSDGSTSPIESARLG